MSELTLTKAWSRLERCSDSGCGHRTCEDARLYIAAHADGAASVDVTGGEAKLRMDIAARDAEIDRLLKAELAGVKDHLDRQGVLAKRNMDVWGENETIREAAKKVLAHAPRIVKGDASTLKCAPEFIQAMTALRDLL